MAQYLLPNWQNARSGVFLCQYIYIFASPLHKSNIQSDSVSFCRVRNVFDIAFRTIATAPQESWNSVAITASAAVALILDPAARALRDSVEDSQDEALGDGHPGDGPVGRARERWKEAQNEMPEVTSCYTLLLPPACASEKCLTGELSTELWCPLLTTPLHT